MTFIERLTIWRLDAKHFIQRLKAKIWNKRILLWWYRLWIRDDEFHNSLDMDLAAMLEMNKEERKNYRNDLMRRRRVAHRRDFD